MSALEALDALLLETDGRIESVRQAFGAPDPYRYDKGAALVGLYGHQAALSAALPAALNEAFKTVKEREALRTALAAIVERMDDEDRGEAEGDFVATWLQLRANAEAVLAGLVEGWPPIETAPSVPTEEVP